MKILLVDDKNFTLNILHEDVEAICPDDEITDVQNPNEVLDIAEKTNFDIAILDINMSRLNRLLLAKKLKDLINDINIVFCTAYSEYAYESCGAFATGYLLKPFDDEAIKRELSVTSSPLHIAYKNRIFVKTFGDFEVFCDGKKVKFNLSQSEEVFAYLIDSRGECVSHEKIASLLWKDGKFDHSRMKQINAIISDIKKTFRKENADDIIIKSDSGYMIDKSTIDCDLYRLLDGDAAVINSYSGKYMSKYSWSDFSDKYFENILF